MERRTYYLTYDFKPPLNSALRTFFANGFYECDHPNNLPGMLRNLANLLEHDELQPELIEEFTLKLSKPLPATSNPPPGAPGAWIS
jgi:hypothetical protein